MTVLVLEAALKGADPSLQRLCRRGPQTLQELSELSLLRAAQRVLQCVARVHSAGWVHCDLKPAHLMRFEGGEGGETWKLVDFGSATRVDAPVAPSHSRRYCSPEQALAFESHGRSVLMRASPGWDVWAAGLIMFEVIYTHFPHMSHPILPIFQNLIIFSRSSSARPSSARRSHMHRSPQWARSSRPRRLFHSRSGTRRRRRCETPRRASCTRCSVSGRWRRRSSTSISSNPQTILSRDVSSKSQPSSRTQR